MAQVKTRSLQRSRRVKEQRQRRELAQRLYSSDPGLDIVHADAAGIDIGNECHHVAVPPGRDPEPVRIYRCFTQDLKQMAEWLKACGIKTVAMQSTGVYWIPVYSVLEEHGLKVFLVNARHTKNLPGRKTDVQECQWLMKLHTFGLLRDSFHPPELIRNLREVWRLRDQLVKDCSRHIQQMQKQLTRMNLQLANVISDIAGVTGQQIVRAIIKGERDAEKLGEYRDPRIQASKEEILRSLEGTWEDGALFGLKMAMDSFDFCRKQMAECDGKLRKYLSAMPDARRKTAAQAPVGATAADAAQAGAGSAGSAELTAPSTEPTEATRESDVRFTSDGRKKRKGGRNRNEPAFDLAAELKRIYGVDLTRIDGIDVMTSQTILAELGTDFSPWQDENHFVSWLMLCPRNDVSGGRVIGRVRDKGRNRVGIALRIAANTLLRSDSYLGARYRALRTSLGAPKAIKAMARHLACLVYRLITQGEEYVDRGQKVYEDNLAVRRILSLQRKAHSMGFDLVPQAALAAN